MKRTCTSRKHTHTLKHLDGLSCCSISQPPRSRSSALALSSSCLAAFVANDLRVCRRGLLLLLLRRLFLLLPSRPLGVLQHQQKSSANSSSSSQSHDPLIARDALISFSSPLRSITFRSDLLTPLTVLLNKATAVVAGLLRSVCGH